jgi:hypothetical protein
LLFGLLVVMVGAAATSTRPAVGVIISRTGFLVMLAAAGRLMAVTAQRPGPSGSARTRTGEMSPPAATPSHHRHRSRRVSPRGLLPGSRPANLVDAGGPVTSAGRR